MRSLSGKYLDLNILKRTVHALTRLRMHSLVRACEVRICSIVTCLHNESQGFNLDNADTEAGHGHRCSHGLEGIFSFSASNSYYVIFNIVNGSMQIFTVSLIYFETK